MILACLLLQGFDFFLKTHMHIIMRLHVLRVSWCTRHLLHVNLLHLRNLRHRLHSWHIWHHEASHHHRIHLIHLLHEVAHHVGVELHVLHIGQLIHWVHQAKLVHVRHVHSVLLWHHDRSSHIVQDLLLIWFFTYRSLIAFFVSRSVRCHL